MAEKIKVSVIIDKEAVKKLAFSISQTPDEYKEVEKIIDVNDELLHEGDEVKEAGNKLIGKIGLNTILRANKDLLLTKRIEEQNKHDEEPGDNDGDDNIKVVKISGDKVKEIIKLVFGKED